LEFTASEAESSLHKGSALVVCGPKVALSAAHAVHVVPNMIMRSKNFPICRFLLAFFILSPPFCL
jgi:hypothetical protein